MREEDVADVHRDTADIVRGGPAWPALAGSVGRPGGGNGAHLQGAPLPAGADSDGDPGDADQGTAIGGWCARVHQKAPRAAGPGLDFATGRGSGSKRRRARDLARHWLAAAMNHPLDARAPARSGRHLATR